ncbi:MAG: DUF4132 domain-containing protein [Myxococcota bacterium]
MPRYELVEGTSSKFWEIALDGSAFTTTWGEIGSAGQSTTTSCSDAAKARKAHDALVAEKTAEGYALVGASLPESPGEAARSASEPAPPSPAPAAARSPRLTLSAAQQESGARGIDHLDLPPRAAEPLRQVHARVLKHLVPATRDAVQHGQRPGPFHDLTRKVLWTWFGPAPCAPDVELDGAAFVLVSAALDGRNARTGELEHLAVLADLVALWVARGGLPYALRVYAWTLGEVAARVEHNAGGPRKVRGLTLAPEGRPATVRAGLRVDRLLRAHLAADPSAREAARAEAEAIRAQGSPLVRAGMSATLTEPPWIDADLQEHAGGQGLLLDVHALHAPRLATLAASVGRLTFDELRAMNTLRGWAVGAEWPYALASRHGADALPVLAALGSRLASLVSQAEPFEARAPLGMLQEVMDLLGASEGSPEAVLAAVDVLARLGEATIAKAEDPRPLAHQIVRRMPEVALPRVRASRARWAQALAPQLERVVSAPSVAEAPASAVPAALVGKPIDKPPAFWTPDAFARPELVGSGALPREAVDVLGRWLKKGEDLSSVKAALAPSSAAAFAWDLFQAWLRAGADSKEKWAFLALGALGDDDTARKLVPLIRAWPGESAHARAVLGLEVLAAIGTDPALMGLHGIAQKVKFKGLQEKAREKMDEIAARRGLTAEQLADRLVPDLDLDDDGSKTLDFGPRTFRVGFDEALSPFVVDASGKRLSDLPKPGAKDDAALAEAAVASWKATKKDARTLAGLQIARLELAMGSQRRWSPLEFEAFLVRHPLLIHLVRRLVWGAYDARGSLVATFRVAEDRSLADADDGPYASPAGADVGVVHRLELDDAAVARWSQVLADYALAQPFPQLSREVFRLDQGERAAASLTRCHGYQVETGALLGLQNRGWRKGPVLDAGVYHCFQRHVGRDLSAWLRFEPGIVIGAPDWTDAHQSLIDLDFAAEEPIYGRNGPTTPLGQIPEVVMSEILRDVSSRGGVLAEVP